MMSICIAVLRGVATPFLSIIAWTIILYIYHSSPSFPCRPLFTLRTACTLRWNLSSSPLHLHCRSLINVAQMAEHHRESVGGRRWSEKNVVRDWNIIVSSAAICHRNMAANMAADGTSSVTAKARRCRHCENITWWNIKTNNRPVIQNCWRLKVSLSSTLCSFIWAASAQFQRFFDWSASAFNAVWVYLATIKYFHMIVNHLGYYSCWKYE